MMITPRALLWTAAILTLAAAILCGATSLIKVRPREVIKGLGLYADDQSGPIMSAMAIMGKLNLIGAVCAALAAVCGIGGLVAGAF